MWVRKIVGPKKILGFCLQESFGFKDITEANFCGLKNLSDPNFYDPKRSILVLWYKATKPKSFEPKTFQAEHFRP